MIVDNISEGWYKVFDDSLAAYRGTHVELYSKMATNPGDFTTAQGEDRIVLCADIPGHSKNNINIEFDGRKLRLKATSGDRIDYKVRYFFPSDNIDPDGITASYKNGVITVTLKKNKKSLYKKRAIGVE